MKRTGKTMTLSGQMPERLFGQQMFRDPHTILEYSNVLDIKRAWRVKDFSCWIQELGNEFAGLTEPAQFGLDVQLSSDDIPNDSDWNNAGDNRAVGWGTLTYFLGDGQYKPALGFSGVSRMLMNSEYWMMDDHVVQNKLTISAGASGSAQLEGVTTGYTLNYIVNLEEYDITPVESIIFNIKSKAQDISS
jgi:hypothetical protein